jgi:hypothetical protein
MVRSPTGLYRCRGRVRGVGFDKKRFSVQEVRAQEEEGEPPGFDGLVVSVSHKLPIYGRTVVLPDLGVLNPRHVDGMKRVGFPSRAFEAAFEVYSDDQVEGRSLIPPDFMERLLAFDPILSGGKGSVAFAGRQMHVVLPTGSLLRFSSDLHFNRLEDAAQHVASEMIQLFTMIAEVDALHSSADRHCPVERVRARDDYYASAVQSIEPAVMAALDAGLIKNDRRAKYFTKDAYLLDPVFRRLLIPRV